MNSETLKAMTGILGMLNPALGVIGAFASSFGGSASTKVAKVTGAVQDAVGVFTAVAPFFEQFGQEKDFTLADVRKALEGFGDELAKFDAQIAAAG